MTAKIPLYPLRHLVRPGLTGWAQVNYPYGADENDALEKLQYEFWYLRHQSLWLDLRIIGRTLRHVLGFRVDDAQVGRWSTSAPFGPRPPSMTPACHHRPADAQRARIRARLP